jgi:hypothetical protein
VKIPRKKKAKEWERLRQSVHLNRIRRDETHRIRLMERRRWLSERIQALEAQHPDANRDYLLQKYQLELSENA